MRHTRLRGSNLPCLDREIVTHEPVEHATVGSLAKRPFHRVPVLFVKFGLKPRLQSHEDEVANQIRLTELFASRVHAFEDQLRIVVISTQSDVNDHELREALAHRPEVARALLDALSEELTVFHHTKRRVARCWRSVHERDQRRAVCLRQEQLVPAVASFFRIEQVVVGDLSTAEAVDRLVIANCSREVRQHDGERGEALLTIDYQQRAWLVTCESPSST